MSPDDANDSSPSEQIVIRERSWIETSGSIWILDPPAHAYTKLPRGGARRAERDGTNLEDHATHHALAFRLRLVEDPIGGDWWRVEVADHRRWAHSSPIETIDGVSLDDWLVSRAARGTDL